MTIVDGPLDTPRKKNQRTDTPRGIGYDKNTGSTTPVQNLQRKGRAQRNQFSGQGWFVE